MPDETKTISDKAIKKRLHSALHIMACTGDQKEYEENKAFLESYTAGQQFSEENDPKTWARVSSGTAALATTRLMYQNHSTAG